MALTVEDGTVVANADSYVTVEYADAYHRKRGNTSWLSASGVIASAVTVSSAAAVGASTITLATDASGSYIFRVGDHIVIGADTYTVTVDTSAVGNSATGTVTISPPVQTALSGGEAVTLDETIKEVALRYATRYVDDAYQWLGSRTTTDSSVIRLDWPRSNVWTMENRYIDSDSIPFQVKDAVCEIALEHLSSALNEVRERGGYVLAHGVGPLFQQFSKGAPPGRTFPYVDAMLSELTGGSGFQPWISRG